MHPCPVPAKTSKGKRRTGQGKSTASLGPVGSPCGYGKSSLETLSILQRSRLPDSGGLRTAWQAHLLLGECRGPAISFSEGGGKIWAALCGDESDIGIDAAGSDEFPSEYPFTGSSIPRASTCPEGGGGDLEKASALLWSIKEAVARPWMWLPSRGSAADHRLSVGRGGRRVYFSVGLSGKALARVPAAAGRSLWHFRSSGKMWLSIALLNWQSPGNDGGDFSTRALWSQNADL